MSPIPSATGLRASTTETLRSNEPGENSLSIAALEPVRLPARLGLFVIAVATIVGYFVVVGFAFSSLSLIDKLVETTLAALIVMDTVLAYRDRRRAEYPQNTNLAGQRR